MEEAMRNLCNLNEVDFDDLHLKLNLAISGGADGAAVGLSRGEILVLLAAMEIAGGV
jgi:hypothetical protein